MNNFTFAVLISGNGSNLQAMIDAVEKKKILGQVCCVLSNKKNAYGLIRAKGAEIPTEVIENDDYSNRQEFEEKMIKVLSKYRPNLIVLAGFMRILSPIFVKQYLGRILNIHPSLLPNYPGLDTHRRVLKSGDKYHGVTIHFVDETLDGGPICAQSSIEIKTNSPKELENEIHKIEYELYPKVINWFGEGRLSLSKNQVFFDNKKLQIEIKK
tara:strand:- start:1032 stop:1667 length:636 start_codon:yes stop_codon:yes gene_type:complete